MIVPYREESRRGLVRGRQWRRFRRQCRQLGSAPDLSRGGGAGGILRLLSKRLIPQRLLQACFRLPTFFPTNWSGTHRMHMETGGFFRSCPAIEVSSDWPVQEGLLSGTTVDNRTSTLSAYPLQWQAAAHFQCDAVSDVAAKESLQRGSQLRQPEARRVPRA